jgi:hypothetical protein
MPKQRNRPHHHRRSRRRGQLALPRIEFSPITGEQRMIFPPGWIFKRGIGMPGAASKVLSMLALILLLCALGWLIVGR